MALTLIIGNKNYSSWSLRPWIAMTAAGIAFDEELIPFESEDFRTIVPAVSGSGRVPVLVDGDIRVWESLAILEYLAEKFPDAGLWPKDAAARAHARVVANEMHAGFQALRNHLPVNFARRVMKRDLPEAVKDNVRRIESLWADCRARFGVKAEKVGPFLFGAFTNADAMYAPVVSRFHTYAVDVTPGTRVYMDAVMALPAYQAWTAAGIAEPWLFAEDEVDWPDVHRADAH
ncbi:glutathione S-transferase family protein [Undibacter mobilis]|uniref:Glutathione S-transferase family protein n=1 Tax=Undibacter mobilis TaxID=2292256 RepID=A0A371BD50_9BRAD|nr:glutathione S-transferase family protein [Undibacter mobilis]RDV05488.1 glutathione S-transferase family protein [Undibacter mobilis]